MIGEIMLNYIDILRVMAESKNSEFEFQLYSENTERGLSKTELAPLHGYVAKGSVQAKLKEDPKASFPIQELMKSEWETMAYFSKDGEVICQRESYGSPMIALKPGLFKQGAYSKMVEESFKSFRTGREILVPEMSETTANSIVKEFNEWKQKEKSE